MKPVTQPPSPPVLPLDPRERQCGPIRTTVLQHYISSSVVVAYFGVTVQHNRFIKTLKWRTFENEHRAACLLTPALH